MAVSGDRIPTRTVTLVLGHSNFKVQAQPFLLNSNLVLTHPDLKIYKVQTQASEPTFREFVRAIEEGSDLSLSPDNLGELSSLSEEFGIGRLQRACDTFDLRVSLRASIDFHLANSARDFTEKVASLVSSLDALRIESHLLNERCGRLESEVRKLKSFMGGLNLNNEISLLKTQLQTFQQSVSALGNLSAEVDQLKRALDQLGGAPDPSPLPQLSPSPELPPSSSLFSEPPPSPESSTSRIPPKWCYWGLPGTETDLLFVLDASSSLEAVFHEMQYWVLDEAVAFHLHHRSHSLAYGAMIYRDGVGSPPDIDAAFQLSESREALEEYLDEVRCSGGSADWVAALDTALHRTNWRNREKWIIWLTNANAQGCKFSGDARDTRTDREEALERLVREMAANDICFVGVNVKQGTDRGCQQTLREMKRIYTEACGPSFEIDDLGNCEHLDRYPGDPPLTSGKDCPYPRDFHRPRGP
jgi:hypothetical protein